MRLSFYKISHISSLSASYLQIIVSSLLPNQMEFLYFVVHKYLVATNDDVRVSNDRVKGLEASSGCSAQYLSAAII